MSEPDITGLRVAITGGTSGLGLALVRHLLAEGAQVAFVARGRDGVERVRREQPHAHGIVGDVSVKEDIHPIAIQVLGALGGLDVLVNNASSLGPVPLAPLADTECEDLERALATNVLGPFRLTKALLGAQGTEIVSGLLLLGNRFVPLALALLALAVSLALVRHRHEGAPCARLVRALVVILVGLGFLAKMILNTRVFHYGFALRVALERQMHVALVDAIPAAQRAAGPGADVLRVRITVTAIEAVDPVKNGVSTTLIGMPIDRGSIAFEARYYEPGAAEPFATVTELHKAGHFSFGNGLSHYGHAVGALRDWGVDLAGSLPST